WPLDEEALEDLRWYLEDYLRAPFGVYSDRGAEVSARLPEWGARLFEAVFGGSGPAREAYVAVRTRWRPLEIVFQSGSARWLGLPWELMRDPGRQTPVALDGVAVTRSLPSVDLAESFAVAATRLRVLMVISRPAGAADVGYQMIARPLLPLLEAVRGNVDVVVLRPPTLKQLEKVLAEAAAAGEPFQIVHFDGHGVFGDGVQASADRGPSMFEGPGPQGMLAFELPGGGADLVPAERVAQVLAVGRVPVVVLNACQSGQVSGQLEAAVATRLLQGGAASVVAMAYSVYAVAAAEFMAVFYERLFAGDRVADAVTAGRQRLRLEDKRPSPKGKLPLADWVVPVHYTRRDVDFPGLHAPRRKQVSLEDMLDQIRHHDRDRGDDAALSPVGTFVGMDGLFYTMESAVRLQKVVVLQGPGGTGKTELAKGFGRWWRDTGGVDQPDGVIWHSFEPGVASFGLDGVITSLGLRVFGTQFAALDTAERRQVVDKLLTERRLLLIWDNFESVHTMPDPTGATPPLAAQELAQLKTFLARIAQADASSVIITSRSAEAWLGDVRRISVGGLNTEEAIDYADQLLEPFPHTLPKRELRVFGELMQWLDGHPLSMRLILPLLDTTGPQHLLDGLRGTTPLPGRDDGDRTTSLAASIAYSFDHLPTADQKALSAVSLFHGITDAGVLGTFSQVEAVPERFTGYDAADWVRILDAAAGVGLLTGLGGGMYRIHPALPAYLADRWRTDEPDTYTGQHAAATRALLDAYTAFSQWLLQQIGGGRAQLAVTVIDLQRRTLGAFLGYALDQQLWDRAQAIAQPLDNYWDLRGLGEEARGWVDRARLTLETANGTPPGLDTPAGQLWMFLVGSQANRHLTAGRLDQAEHTYLDILHTLQQQPETPQQRRHLATAHHQLGRVAQDRGRLEDAENWYRQSLTIREDLGDRPHMASSYHQLGTVAQHRGRLEDAENWYRQSLTIREDLGDRPHMATSYH
ncbi:MAG: hypothetical protein JWL97_3945, partial [Gemmatimonadales bacterium]|nr:hypothetical protein [Gemmatimonadales bacterium]